MGALCCVPTSQVRPRDPSITVFAPVTSMFLIYDGFIYFRCDTTIDYGPGLAYVKGDQFIYYERCRERSLSFSLKDFQTPATTQTGVCLYTGDRWTTASCTCWPCQGCPNGAVDAVIRTSKGECQLILTMPNPQEFAEKLNAEIGKAITTRYDTFRS